jgi:photosynthetic reaction center cytochrome c subunit
MTRNHKLVPALVLLLGAFALACERPPMETEQKGFRGLGLESVQNPRSLARTLDENQAPEPLPPVQPGGPSAGSVYKNVQVLDDLSVTEFARLMVAITQWVSPEQGCNYCHVADLASDEKYTKTVSRRMIQMTRHINEDWTAHVKQTGVTCYTCHRGQPVPTEVWSMDPGPIRPAGMVGNDGGQNHPAPAVGLTSLPYDVFTPFLAGKEEIRIQSPTPLPQGNRRSIKETEWTYGFMIHISESLGVNCTYCHNSRSFKPWEASSPARADAWYAIRMLRNVNNEYIGALADVFPADRKGPMGDVLKANCATCHRGLPKPLNGAQMVQHYPGLASVKEMVPLHAAAPPPSPPLRPEQP